MIDTIKGVTAKLLFDFLVMTSILYSVPALLFGVENTNEVLMGIVKEILR